MEIRDYLGDSVYAKVENDELTVYLDNGEGAFNEIVFEPEVFQALTEFALTHLSVRYFHKR